MIVFVSLICLLVSSGLCNETWSVSYLNTVKCVLKGSTALLSGSFTHPDNLSITRTFWTINPAKGKETTDLSDDPAFKDRLQYNLSKDRKFLLKLRNVTDKDDNMYCFRIITDVEREKFLGYPGVRLTVTELRVEIPEEVLEGESVVLFCRTTCTFVSSTKYRWYKNRSPLSEWLSTNELRLQSVRGEDSGQFSCAVAEHADLLSAAGTLSVRYPPKNTSVSISGSGELVAGGSVTLTCSSESHPPVQNYSWFKENQTSAVGSGQSFRALESGRFYCEAHNKHGSQRSAAVSVIHAGHQRKILDVTAGMLAALIAVCVVIVVTGMIRKTTASTGGGDASEQENISVVDAHPAACDSEITTNQNDLTYASIAHVRSCRDQTGGDDDEVQYTTVHHHKHTQKNNTDAETFRCNAELVEGSSVIYSSIRVT